MAVHAEDSLRGSGVSKILDLFLAVATLEAIGTKRLIACQDGQILNLVSTVAAAVGAVVANEGSVSEEQKIRVRVEQGAAGIATKTVNMPSISG